MTFLLSSKEWTNNFFRDIGWCDFPSPNFFVFGKFSIKALLLFSVKGAYVKVYL
jgi:hypothetical protein